MNGKTVGEQNTSFLLDGDNIVAETRGGSLVSRYVYGVNLVSCRSGSSLLYYHQNAHGDVVKITTAAGAVNRSYDYDAFGNEKDPASADANPFRYCGEYWDSETETYYLRARYYDPSIGRFTQQDTHWNTANMIYGDNPQKINERQDALGLTAYTYVPQISAIMQSGNLYVYCVNSPISYVDHTGNSALAATLTTTAGVMGGSGAVNLWNPLGYVMLGASALLGIVAVGLAVDAADTDNKFAQNITKAGSTPASPKPPDDDQSRNWRRVKEKYLERQLALQGTDPHQIKYDYLGEKCPVKNYDIYVDINTGQLGIFHKATGRLAAITDFFIK